MYIGADAEHVRGLLRLKYPLAHGIVEDWADMESIWRHIYLKLGVQSQDRPVLLTEPPLNPLANREKAAEILFETFSVPGLFLSMQAVLSLYASASTTGVVLDCGDGVTHCVPIYDGFSLSHAVSRVDLAGRDVTEQLVEQLRMAGWVFETSAEMEVVKSIKEKVCFVAPRTSKGLEPPPLDPSSKAPTPYLLPDGRSLTMNSGSLKIGSTGSDNLRVPFSNYEAPEILFSPETIEMEIGSVQSCLIKAIQKADVDLRRTLFGSIYLAGGTTMMPGFPERLLNELIRLCPRDVEIKITAPPERKISCWLGGSILSSLSSFKNMWIKKHEYEEEGRRILHTRTF